MKPTKWKKGERWWEAEFVAEGGRVMRGQSEGLAWREAMSALGADAAQLESSGEMRPLAEAREVLSRMKLEKVRCE